ncbi:hypothetical protein [Spirosoma endbachense]|nr:hypothetical protein [Spirosoma endbachense]
MKLIHLQKCRSMEEAIAFYTGMREFYVTDSDGNTLQFGKSMG